MVMKIPDSGGVMGSDPVLRQPSFVEPQKTVKVNPLDITPVIDGVQSLGKAYLEQIMKDGAEQAAADNKKVVHNEASIKRC